MTGKALAGRPKTAEHHARIKATLIERYGTGKDGTHFCRSCKTTRPLAEFSLDPKRDNRPRNPCKPCRRDDAKRRYREQGRDPAVSRRYWLIRNYGITPEDYDRMLAGQGGVCAICRQPESNPTTDLLVVDHDHVTGTVRALLCRRCNVGIGTFTDDPALLRAAVEYLESHACSYAQRVAP